MVTKKLTTKKLTITYNELLESIKKDIQAVKNGTAEKPGIDINVDMLGLVKRIKRYIPLKCNHILYIVETTDVLQKLAIDLFDYTQNNCMTLTIKSDYLDLFDMVDTHIEIRKIQNKI